MLKRFAHPVLLCTLLLASALTSSAQMIFRIDTLTADELSITIFGGPGSALLGSPSDGRTGLNFSLASGAPMLSSDPEVTVLPSGGTNFNIFTASSHADSADYRGVYLLSLYGSLSEGEYFTSDVHVTWSGDNVFNLAVMDGGPLALYWGTDSSFNYGTGVLQSSASYTPAVAVPEPSTYAAIAGAATLGLAAWRRHRQRAAGAAIAV